MDCIINNRFYRRVSGVIIPVFTYTGTFTTIDDGNNNWRIKFLTSGNLIFSDLGSAINGIDIFMVGGGSASGKYWGNEYYGHGGSGGFTKTVKNKRIRINTTYSIVIGAGGVAQNNAFEAGGETSGFGETVAGGTMIEGGCGGAAYENRSDGYSGGSDGADGGGNPAYTAGQWAWASRGKGQGTTTREFGEPNGDLYAGGGGAGASGGSTGGAGGGGNGGTQNTAPGKGLPNTGGGGGGFYINHPYGDGGSGILIIRNKRS